MVEFSYDDKTKKTQHGFWVLFGGITFAFYCPDDLSDKRNLDGWFWTLKHTDKSLTVYKIKSLTKFLKKTFMFADLKDSQLSLEFKLSVTILDIERRLYAELSNVKSIH